MCVCVCVSFLQHVSTALRMRMRYFYIEKYAQRTVKPVHNYFQTIEKFTSILAPISESRGPKNLKSVKALSRVSGLNSLNERSTMQKNVRKLVDGKWVRIQRF